MTNPYKRKIETLNSIGGARKLSSFSKLSMKFFISAIVLMIFVLIIKSYIFSSNQQSTHSSAPALAQNSPQPPPTLQPGEGSSSSVIWQATHETGDVSEWFDKDTGNPMQDSGWCERPKKGVSKDFSHSGEFSLKMSIQSYIPKSGCRQFRYPEIRTGEPYYYSAWIYLPHNYRFHGWTNLMQLKSKLYSKKGAHPSELFWALRLFNRESGNIYLQLQWDKSASVPGPRSTDAGGTDVKFDQTIKDFPAQQWVHLEMYVKQSDQFDGQIIVWQDGEEIYNLQNIRTKLPEGFNSWSVNAYGAHTAPPKFSVYVDDVAISSERLGTSYNYLKNDK